MSDPSFPSAEEFMADQIRAVGKPAWRAVHRIIQERQKQERKWGEQNHDPFCYLTVLMEEVGELSQAALHARFGGDAANNMMEEAVQVAAARTMDLEPPV